MVKNKKSFIKLLIVVALLLIQLVGWSLTVNAQATTINSLNTNDILVFNIESQSFFNTICDTYYPNGFVVSDVPDTNQIFSVASMRFTTLKLLKVNNIWTLRLIDNRTMNTIDITKMTESGFKLYDPQFRFITYIGQTITNQDTLTFFSRFFQKSLIKENISNTYRFNDSLISNVVRGESITNQLINIYGDSNFLINGNIFIYYNNNLVLSGNLLYCINGELILSQSSDLTLSLYGDTLNHHINFDSYMTGRDASLFRITISASTYYGFSDSANDFILPFTPSGNIVGTVSNWSDFFGSLVLVPINYFRQFLSFDLFGKTLFLVLCGVITILVAIWLVKKFK